MLSNHLLELQKEIKEEEDEIFADINSLLNSCSYSLHSTSAANDYDNNDDDGEDNNYSENNAANLITGANNANNILPHPPDLPVLSATFNKTPLNGWLCESTATSPSALRDDQAMVHQQDQDDPGLKTIQAAVLQRVTSNLPKPCVFFLEGNCRRSDCKYSHDLSRIPCKYWLEGFCFKGEMCPFLHSFGPALNDLDNNEYDDNDAQADALKKKQLDPTFAIESEADFPSLPLDAPPAQANRARGKKNVNATVSDIENHLLNSNSAVVLKTIKKKRRKG